VACSNLNVVFGAECRKNEVRAALSERRSELQPPTHFGYFSIQEVTIKRRYFNAMLGYRETPFFSNEVEGDVPPDYPTVCESHVNVLTADHY